MLKLLKKLPMEGLLIIIIVLISLIVLIYLTKINSVINSNNKIIITNINQENGNNAEFISTTDLEDKIILTKPTPKAPEEITESKKKIRLFFIKVDGDGEIDIKSVLKTVFVGKTPLSKSLEQLLKGPDTEDINRGLLTLIPEDVEILSISIKAGVAYINFNEMFRFNQLGVEGYLAQIKQIVYTATEYDSVKSVQFIIDGERQEYLGPEGVYIGRPISREDLKL
ncbi:MAG: hypothetical protein B6229_01465 [Spirochaetaceae bacterium 4572_7]|nr:MAG: hypothetical protein B6229_01465 [Spirochaetaceae bacterium 4572_7]